MSQQIVSKAVGIDLGTTNSAVAVMNPSDSDIVIHRDPVSKSSRRPAASGAARPAVNWSWAARRSPARAAPRSRSPR
ncbi:hypothetical protein ACFQ0Q_24130 [Streptomyces aureus]